MRAPVTFSWLSWVPLTPSPLFSRSSSCPRVTYNIFLGTRVKTADKHIMLHTLTKYHSPNLELEQYHQSHLNVFAITPPLPISIKRNHYLECYNHAFWNYLSFISPQTIL